MKRASALNVELCRGLVMRIWPTVLLGLFVKLFERFSIRSSQMG